MSSDKVCGMILAAGFGERLRPLTNEMPKPMIPVGGRPLIDYHLALMARAGVSDVIINLHWLGHLIERHVGDGAGFGLKVSYSREREIMGTGGGIKLAEKFIGGRVCLIVNADILFDVDPADVLRAHFDENCPATMVLKPLAPDEKFIPLRATANRVASIDGKVPYQGPPTPPYVYTGLQALDPSCLDYLRPEFSSIVDDFYIRALKEGTPIAAYHSSNFWSDLGTMERYEKVRDNPPFEVSW